VVALRIVEQPFSSSQFVCDATVMVKRNRYGKLCMYELKI
jgi:hypothetical protein